MGKLLALIDSGFITGEATSILLNYAKENQFAYPAVNVIGTNSVNAALEAASEINSPIIILWSGIFYW